MPDTSRPVLVTGAAGFIASYVVRDLLAEGWRVRGTVRSLVRPEPIAHLRALGGADSRLELVAADLLAPGAFDRAAEGCAAVIHTASPYVLHARNPQKDLVEPALEGTRNVLGAAARARVGRVVVTSSMAAITDEPDGGVLTEADWNWKSSLARNPYYYSKTLAEHEAWKIAKEAPLDLVVINPFLVIGPSMTKALNPSNQVIADILSGTYPGLMSLAWGLVDVRDVSLAHLRAVEVPSAQGRYVCANRVLSMREMVDVLRGGGFDRYKLPTRPLDNPVGSLIVRATSYFQPSGVGSYLRTHIGGVPRFDNRKIQRDLGVTFRSVEQSILDTAADLVKWGHVGQK